MATVNAWQRRRRAPVSPWSDDRVAYVRARWMQGATAQQISVELEGGVSRSAVLGIVYRLRLSDLALALAMRQHGKGATSEAIDGENAEYAKAVEPGPLQLGWHRPGRRQRMPPWIAKAVPYVDEPGTDATIPISQRRSLGELNERTCRWPVGDPIGSDFFFCGAEPVPGEPYCSAHWTRAYRSSRDAILRGPRRRRSRALSEQCNDETFAGPGETAVDQIERESK
jgi:GcrA cell cycle regulator